MKNRSRNKVCLDERGEVVPNRWGLLEKLEKFSEHRKESGRNVHLEAMESTRN